MVFIYVTSTNLVDFSLNQHSENQNKDSRITLVTLPPHFGQGTVKTYLKNQRK